MFTWIFVCSDPDVTLSSFPRQDRSYQYEAWRGFKCLCVSAVYRQAGERQTHPLPQQTHSQQGLGHDANKTPHTARDVRVSETLL